jgi:hypothetical protein
MWTQCNLVEINLKLPFFIISFTSCFWVSASFVMNINVIPYCKKSKSTLSTVFVTSWLRFRVFPLAIPFANHSVTCQLGKIVDKSLSWWRDATSAYCSICLSCEKRGVTDGRNNTAWVSPSDDAMSHFLIPCRDSYCSELVVGRCYVNRKKL